MNYSTINDRNLQRIGLQSEENDGCVSPTMPDVEDIKESSTDLNRSNSQDSTCTMERTELPIPLVRFMKRKTDVQQDEEEDNKLTIQPVRVKHSVASYKLMVDFAKDGKVTELEEMLQPGHMCSLINKLDTEGLTLLHYAARCNQAKVCKLLIQHGAMVNTLGPEQMTPLHMAAKYRRSCAKPLPGKFSLETTTSLMASLPKKNLPYSHERLVKKNSWRKKTFPQLQEETDVVVDCLIEKNADFTLKDFYGCTPLHYAAMKGNTKAVRSLLNSEMKRQKNIDKTLNGKYKSTTAIWEIRDNEDMMALHLSCAHKEPEIVKLLVDVETNCKEYLETEENSGSTPLHLACAEGNIEICGMLFTAIVKFGEGFLKRCLNRKDMEHNTPLHIAVFNVNVDIAEMCINKGSNVNAVNALGETPLHLAARMGNIQLVDMLIQSGARINATDSNRQTSLHHAAYYNQTELLTYMLQTDNSMINATDCERNTPLLLASMETDDATAVNVLLSYNADPTVRNEHDKTAIYLAAEWDNTTILKSILENATVQEHNIIDESDENNNTPLHIACKKGYMEVVDMLLKYGAKYDDKNEDEETPMHIAAANGRSKIIRKLIKLDKTLVNDEDEDSNTPLHLAALNGHAKVCQILLEEGQVDIDSRNSSGWTALDCAANKGSVKVAEILLENDCPIDPTDKSNVTPLYLACKSGHKSMVELLLHCGAKVNNRIKYPDTNNPLHNCNCLDAAIDNGHKRCALLIINSSQWKEALRNETTGEKGEKNTPLRKMIKQMPYICEAVLNKCVTTNKGEGADDPNMKFVFNFEFVDDMFADWKPKRFYTGGSQDDGSWTGGSSNAGSEVDAMTEVYNIDGYLRQDIHKPNGNIKKNHPLALMVKMEREDLLQHPLVLALLSHKWKSYGKAIFYFHLMIYVIYLTAFTIFMIDSKPPYMHYKPYYETYNITGWTSNECEQILAKYTSCQQSETSAITKILVLIFAIIFIIKEIIEIFMSKLEYINFENLIDWTVFLLAIVTVIDLDNCQKTCGVRTHWQWNCGSVGILISWLNLVLYIRKLPRFGIYIIMFTNVFITFAKFSIIFFLFVLSFAISFYCLMQNQFAFETMGRSIIRTIVMMVGEFAYDAIFSSQYESPKDPNVQVFYDGVTYPVFVLFVIIVSIIVMNLLMGLAVDDINAVQNEAILKRIAMQVELVLEIEATLPLSSIRKYIIKNFEFFPNLEINKPYYKLKSFLQQDWMNKDDLISSLNPELDEHEKLYQKQDKMDLSLNYLKDKIINMKQQSRKFEAMVLEIVKHLNINVDIDENNDSTDIVENIESLMEI